MSTKPGYKEEVTIHNIDYTRTSWIQTLTKTQLAKLLSNLNIKFDSHSGIEQLRKLLKSHIHDKQRKQETEHNETPENETNKAHKIIHMMSEHKASKLEFILGKDDWETYTERLELYFLVNDIPAEKHAAVLLTKIDPETYNLTRDLCMPDKPSTKTYAQLVALIKDHLNPKPSEAMERCKFHQAQQASTESVADFVARLKRLSLYCNFPNVSNAVRDQIVCGLKDHATKKALFREENLTYNTAYKIATQMETAEKDATTTDKLNMSTVPSTSSVQWTQQPQQRLYNSTQGFPRGNRQYARGSSRRKIMDNSSNTQNPNQRTITCYCCGKDNHMARDCFQRYQTCKTCHRKGHLTIMCRTKKSEVQHLQAASAQEVEGGEESSEDFI